ncbi:chitin-binding type-2 domain-containing protein [Nephila pilipes]|uniref:Chitin-binding type-2 domain-containing protein n=1 Tax=Nephila pilipes TaxID=299642 RepID=A0A8X6MCT4_NEPPI|nr:chitin-binding type-2 domain-containing protein [Nephila pilipes]
MNLPLRLPPTGVNMKLKVTLMKAKSQGLPPKSHSHLRQNDKTTPDWVRDEERQKYRRKNFLRILIVENFIMMQICLFFFMLIGSALAKSTSWDKKEKYALPEGAELLVGPVRSTFQCFANGYYADTDNNCQIFHICSSTDSVDGTRTQMQYSFLCGNQTVFNQLTFTCTYPEDAVPCVHAQDFYYLNSHIESDDPEIHFLDDQDVQRAAPLIGAEPYSRRVEKPIPQYQPVRRRFDFEKRQ